MSREAPGNDWTPTIRRLTQKLRGSQEPFWVNLRAWLAEREIDPGGAVLAGAFPNDLHIEFGLVLAREGRVIRFELDDPAKPEEEKVVDDWEDITDEGEHSPFYAELECARRLLAGET